MFQASDKKALPASGGPSEPRASCPRLDVDGAGGLLMGFIASLTKQHQWDQQQQVSQKSQGLATAVNQQQQSQPQQFGEESTKKVRPDADKSLPKEQELHYKQRQPAQQQVNRRTTPSVHSFPRVRHKHAARMDMDARLAADAAAAAAAEVEVASPATDDTSSGVASGSTTDVARCRDGSSSSSISSGSSSSSRPSIHSSKKGRGIAGEDSALERPKKRTGSIGAGAPGSNNSSSSKSKSKSMRDAVAPPRWPLPNKNSPKTESRKRPRNQQSGALLRRGEVSPLHSPNGSMDTEEGPLSSEDGTSEGGGYDQDEGSWGGGSGKDSGSTEESNEASVSEGDYRAEDERSSSFEERECNDRIGQRRSHSSSGRKRGLESLVAKEGDAVSSGVSEQQGGKRGLQVA